MILHSMTIAHFYEFIQKWIDVYDIVERIAQLNNLILYLFNATQILNF